jgi:hypothetical protein
MNTLRTTLRGTQRTPGRDGSQWPRHKAKARSQRRRARTAQVVELRGRAR